MGYSKLGNNKLRPFESCKNSNSINENSFIYKKKKAFLFCDTIDTKNKKQRVQPRQCLLWKCQNKLVHWLQWCNWKVKPYFTNRFMNASASPTKGLNHRSLLSNNLLFENIAEQSQNNNKSYLHPSQLYLENEWFGRKLNNDLVIGDPISPLHKAVNVDPNKLVILVLMI